MVVNPDLSGQCPQCDEVHDWDINAAINIEQEGLRILKISSGGGLSSDAKSLDTDVSVQKQVEALPLGESVKPEAPRPRFKVPKIGDKSAYSSRLAGGL